MIGWNRTLLGRDFVLFFLAAAVSAVGSALVPVALSFALLNSGRSADALGLVMAARTVPVLVFLLIGGVVGDRWPRRRVMIGADGLRFVAQAVLAVLLVRGGASLAAIAGLGALIGVGTAFFYPAGSGFVAQLVPKEQLTRANSVLGAANSVAGIIGPAAAGAIVVFVGAGWAIGLDALTYAVSAACLTLVRHRGEPGAGQGRGSVFQDIRLGFQIFVSRRWLWLIVGQFGLLNLVAFTPFLVLGPVLMADLPHGASIWGGLMSAAGVGGLLGAAALMRWPPVRVTLVTQAAVVLLMLPLVLFAMQARVPVLVAGAVAYGAGTAAVSALVGTAIQREIPTNLLSRVFSIVQIAAGVLAPAGYVLTGPAATWLGPHRALAAGAAIGFASAVALVSFADIRRFGTAGMGSATGTPF